jgi:hypothetical protein
MKTRSNVMPGAAYEIERLQNGTASVLFVENVEEVLPSEEKTYEYDEYRIEIPYRDTLNADIEANYAKWLKFAKDKEYDVVGNEIRAERNHLLALCDWTQNADSPLDSDRKSAWVTYRQALRDVPEQQGFPYDVVWPTQP